VVLGVLAPLAHGFGIAKWEAGTCTTSVGCEYSNPGAFYTQAAGHPAWGLTAFEVTGAQTGPALKRIRVDIPAGLAADPVTLPACAESSFDANACPAQSKAGIVELKVYVEVGFGTTLPLKGNVYDLGERPGLPLLFGIDVEGVPPLVSNVHLLLEGHVSDTREPGLQARGAASGDYHEYFEINNIPQEVAVEALGLVKVANAPLKTVESKLFFEGHAGGGNFLTLPSNCSSTTTSYLELESYGGEHASAVTHTPVGVEGCGAVPFSPTATVTPGGSESGYGAPDGAVTELRVPQNEGASEINTADVQDAHVTLPEGLTLNPSAAAGLEACTQAQLARGSGAPSSCPAGSKIGTVEVETDLPPHSLAGNVYLGKPNGTGLIGGPPYLVFIDAESVYGVSLRLEGEAVPNPVTGRLEVSFTGNPQLPFSSLTLRLDGGPRAPLANPESCAAGATEFLFTPWTGGAPFSAGTPFAASGCPPVVPFALSQSTQDSSPKAGAATSYTLSLGRAEGEQYLSQIHTVLPAGLIGAIPTLTPCPEPEAQAGACASSSLIGSASVSVGAGAEPIAFSGPVYLTGPYGGAPYGLSIPIRAAAGPFDLGTVVTRATVGVETYSGRVAITASLPSIVGGVPLRLRSVSVSVTRPGFLTNPTGCGALASESVLTSALGASARASSAFQVSGCGALGFTPSLSASASVNTSDYRAQGAALTVNLTQGAHQANLRSVVVQLPKQLPTRLSTLNKACAQAVAEADIGDCPAEYSVGTATVTTPVLPGSLSGPAYLVSHGGEAFPDLELLLEGDHGVRVILVGKTDIRDGITTSDFATLPDVPISSFRLSLPTGRFSALTAYGSLCPRGGLLMPTTITAQSGRVLRQSTRISVTACGVRVLSHRLRGHTLLLRVQSFAAGRLSAGGRSLRTLHRRLPGPEVTTLKLALSGDAMRTLARRHRLRLRVRLGFVPRNRSHGSDTQYATIRLR
jgi:hypothetical protein